MNRITAFFDRIVNWVAKHPNLEDEYVRPQSWTGVLTANEQRAMVEAENYRKAKKIYDELADYARKDVALTNHMHAVLPPSNHASGSAYDIFTPVWNRYSTRWYVQKLVEHYGRLYPNSIVGVYPLIESKFTVGYKVYVNAPAGDDPNQGNVLNIEISNAQAREIVEWDENPDKSFDVRQEKREWLEEEPDRVFVDIGPETFTDQDGTVISHKGNNFYAACGKVTRPDVNDPDADWTCVKRVGHPSPEHEDWEGGTSTDAEEPEENIWAAPELTDEEITERQLRDRRTMSWLRHKYEAFCQRYEILVVDEGSKFVIKVNGSPTYWHSKPEAWDMMEKDPGFPVEATEYIDRMAIEKAPEKDEAPTDEPARPTGYIKGAGVSRETVSEKLRAHYSYQGFGAPVTVTWDSNAGKYKIELHDEESIFWHTPEQATIVLDEDYDRFALTPKERLEVMGIVRDVHDYELRRRNREAFDREERASWDILRRNRD